MIFSFEERPSDSPFVETIWRAQSERAGAFSSLAASHWEIVVTKHNGKMTLTVRRPETKATPRLKSFEKLILSRCRFCSRQSRCSELGFKRFDIGFWMGYTDLISTIKADYHSW